MGTGSGLASQGALQFSADGRFLIAVDAGSNQISVLRVHSDGSLSLVPGGVVSSHGVLPDSLAVHGDLVYVANSGASHSNYTGFRFSPRPPVPHPRSTVTLASDAAPGDVLFNSTGTKLVGTEVGPSLIDSFTVGSGGRLTAAPGSPFPAQGLGPFGSGCPPSQPRFAITCVQRPQHRQGQRHRLGVQRPPGTAGCPGSPAHRSRTTRWPRAG